MSSLILVSVSRVNYRILLDTQYEFGPYRHFTCLYLTSEQLIYIKSTLNTVNHAFHPSKSFKTFSKYDTLNHGSMLSGGDLVLSVKASTSSFFLITKI